MKNHITKVMTYYKGQCYAWDVVNEAFEEDGSYRQSVFFKTVSSTTLEHTSISSHLTCIDWSRTHPNCVQTASEVDSEVDPGVKIFYNDYNIESAGGKSAAALNVVRGLKARGIRIDGVGSQAHFTVGSTPSLAAQTSNLESFTAQLSTRANDYANTVSACLAVEGCVGITIWDFTDKYSWVPSTFQGAGEACLYNDDFSKKPAYTAELNVLGGSASGG
jgi:endo-1,4-beta-xylanase